MPYKIRRSKEKRKSKRRSNRKKNQRKMKNFKNIMIGGRAVALTYIGFTGVNEHLNGFHPVDIPAENGIIDQHNISHFILNTQGLTPVGNFYIRFMGLSYYVYPEINHIDFGPIPAMPQPFLVNN